MDMEGLIGFMGAMMGVWRRDVTSVQSVGRVPLGR